MKNWFLLAVVALAACGGGDPPDNDVEIAIVECSTHGGVATSERQIVCLNDGCTERRTVLVGTCADGTPFRVEG